mmetsp:Transcript_73781/g.162934  ORF Transcript_73781/g.162934 Transcript_73781/m.162934 type:complete len:384 (+) Transcript_73781:92-1243(+)
MSEGPPEVSAPLASQLTAECGAVNLVANERSRQSTWAKEYADPWMLLANALGVVGYQIVSMFLVAYQVLWRRRYIMECWQELSTFELWMCEYTKAYTRFFPLVAILISMSLVRSMILIQRMYYELLHHGAILRFKEYQAKNEPLFYVLTICLLHAVSNFLMDTLTPRLGGRNFELLEGTRGWFVYLVIPIATFVCSMYFAHEPSYNLVPLSRYVHGESKKDEEAAQEELKKLVYIDEEHVQAICHHFEVKPCKSAAETAQVYQELIRAAKDFCDSGHVIVGHEELTKKLTSSQITDRFWPARFLFQPALQDEASLLFRRVSRSYDLCCVLVASFCVWLFADCAYADILDVANGQEEDLAALLVEAAHLAFGLFYIAQILRSTR